MRRAIIPWVFGAMSAFALADNEGDSFYPGPSVTSSSQAAVLTPDWYGLLRRNMGSMLEKRVVPGVRTADETKDVNLEQWSKETVSICASKLNSTSSVSNPAGVAGCWNLPFLVDENGVFMADLRMFRVQEPSGDWADADDATYKARVQFEGSAAMQQRNMSLQEMAASKAGMENSTLTKIVDAQFVGNVNTELLKKDLPDTELKVMVTPQIILTAMSTTGKALSANISIEDAKFVNGVFSTTPTLNAQEAAEVKEAPFELPGTKILIVPVGLYFFSIYLLIACAIYGWGTFERAKFRDQYRKRIAGQGFK